MNILNYTTRPSSWQTGVIAEDRNDLFNVILDVTCTPEFLEANPKLTKEAILHALIEREETRTTAMGNGIAFPHARLPDLERAYLAVVTLARPVLFGEEEVSVVCMILAPASDPAVSLKMMAQLARSLSKEPVLAAALNAPDGDALYNLFRKHNPRVDQPIIAQDIMRLPRYSLKADDKISDGATLMSSHSLRAIPVVDDDNKIIGEVTVDRMFSYGLPEFFSKLKSVSFIAEFDPFEKYFEDERDMLVSQLMTTDVRVVPISYTLLEVVFDLTIKPYVKLYVVDDDDRWVGTIDKGTLLDNVINH